MIKAELTSDHFYSYWMKRLTSLFKRAPPLSQMLIYLDSTSAKSSWHFVVCKGAAMNIESCTQRVLIPLKSTAAVVRISSLFWSYSLWVCCTGTDQCPAVTSEGCGLCSPFVILRFVILEMAILKNVPVNLFLFVNICYNGFLCQSFSCLEWINSWRLCMYSNVSVSAVTLPAGPVNKDVCLLTGSWGLKILKYVLIFEVWQRSVDLRCFLSLLSKSKLNLFCMQVMLVMI